MLYSNICSGRQAFIDAHHAVTNVPHELLDILWEAIVHPMTATLEREFTAIFATPPTYAEFEAAIKASSTNTSPGLSRVTNNMLKCLPKSMSSKSPSQSPVCRSSGRSCYWTPSEKYNECGTYTASPRQISTASAASAALILPPYNYWRCSKWR